jgi:hypothetical protein
MDKKTILSWDVGIKNLAYCLIVKSGDDFEIKDWSVINLMETGKTCQFVTRSKTICGKQARCEVKNKDNLHFCQLFINSTVCLCDAHSEKAKPEFDIIKKPTDKNICTYAKCKEFAKCKVIGSDEYCWCDKHYEKGKLQFLKKIVTKKVVIPKCKADMPTIAKMFEILDKHPDMLKVDEVVIENQPAIGHPPMKIIAHALFSYFIMKGITEKAKTKSTITDVKFVSASNKLKVNKTTTSKVLKDAKENDKLYKTTKKLGIKYCQSLINEKDVLILSKYKKKDDMCDSFLQGFYYLFNPLPEKHFEKLKNVGLEVATKKKKSKKGKNIKDNDNDSDNTSNNE